MDEQGGGCSAQYPGDLAGYPFQLPSCCSGFPGPSGPPTAGQKSNLCSPAQKAYLNFVQEL